MKNQEAARHCCSAYAQASYRWRFKPYLVNVLLRCKYHRLLLQTWAATSTAAEAKNFDANYLAIRILPE